MMRLRNNILILNTLCIVVAALLAANYRVIITLQNDINLIREDAAQWLSMIAQYLTQ
jgi:hypothetical protein